MIYTFDLSRADDVIAITVNVHAASIEGALATLVSQTRSGGLVARCAPVGTEDGVVEIALSMAGYGPFHDVSSDLIVGEAPCACHPAEEEARTSPA
jgi:hypothetical protein